MAANQPRLGRAIVSVVARLNLTLDQNTARQLAQDYAAGRSDARTLLKDLESGQFELLNDDGA